MNVPVESISSEEASDHFGFLGTIASLDFPRSSDTTQKLLVIQGELFSKEDTEEFIRLLKKAINFMEEIKEENKMEIIVTGSLGNISKPLAQKLVQNGHSVTVISSKAERQKEIEALGAKAAIGSVLDYAFLLRTFTGADIVYLMEPPAANSYGAVSELVATYKKAVEQSGVKKIVHLSSIGV